MDDNKKPLDMRYVVFGPDLNANSDFVVGPNGIARRGTPQAEWISKSKLPANTTKPLKSKLQPIKPIPEKEKISTAQTPEKETATTECNPMKTPPANSSFADLIKDPAFRWALLYILLAVLIYCLWPRAEYVSIGHGLILNKRTGEVHRACDRIKK